jgi:hypothetical protein
LDIRSSIVLPRSIAWTVEGPEFRGLQIQDIEADDYQDFLSALDSLHGDAELKARV